MPDDAIARLTRLSQQRYLQSRDRRLRGTGVVRPQERDAARGTYRATTETGGTINAHLLSNVSDNQGRSLQWDGQAIQGERVNKSETALSLQRREKRGNFMVLWYEPLNSNGASLYCAYKGSRVKLLDIPQIPVGAMLLNTAQISSIILTSTQFNASGSATTVANSVGSISRASTFLLLDGPTSASISTSGIDFTNAEPRISFNVAGSPRYNRIPSVFFNSLFGTAFPAFGQQQSAPVLATFSNMPVHITAGGGVSREGGISWSSSFSSVRRFWPGIHVAAKKKELGSVELLAALPRSTNVSLSGYTGTEITFYFWRFVISSTGVVISSSEINEQNALQQFQQLEDFPSIEYPEDSFVLPQGQQYEVKNAFLDRATTEAERYLWLKRHLGWENNGKLYFSEDSRVEKLDQNFQRIGQVATPAPEIPENGFMIARFYIL